MPTLKETSTTHLELNTGTASVHYYRDNRKLALLLLTVQPEILDTLSSVKFVPPTNPGQDRAMIEASVGLTSTRRAHKEQFDEHLKCDLFDKDPKSLLIESIDEDFIQSLYNKHIMIS